LLPLYQARNYPRSLSDEQRKDWEAFCQQRLQDGGPQSRLNRFAARLQQLGERTDLTQKQRYILEELQLYAESIVQLPEE
jgi:exodeoxyribonuclease-1